MYPSALRATSSTHARRNRAGLRRRVAHLCATQCTRQPAGASSDCAGRQSGRPCGAVHGARHRHDRRVDGDSQGWGRLCAARSGLSGRASEPHPHRCHTPAVARRCRGSRSAGRYRCVDRARPQCIARWLVATRRSANDCRPAAPRLCDLYLGFHWYTQGRCDRTPERRQLSDLESGCLHVGGAFADSVCDLPQFRSLDLRVFRSFDTRRYGSPGRQRPRTRQGSARGEPHQYGAIGHYFVAGFWHVVGIHPDDQSRRRAIEARADEKNLCRDRH
ncbi:hypothetical protein AWB81_08530 [Caballeronia arationis]|nr:hypothetical protein AWB81_08530 [Caballeronia arationis]